MNHRPDRATLYEELAYHEARITDAYWTFTRTKRGKPPSLVVPESYARATHLRKVIRALPKERSE